MNGTREYHTERSQPERKELIWNDLSLRSKGNRMGKLTHTTELVASVREWLNGRIWGNRAEHVGDGCSVGIV